MGATFDIVQDVCLNVAGVLVHYNQLDRSTQMLQFCGALFKDHPTKQHHSRLFSELSKIIGRDQPRAAYYLQQLSKLYVTQLLQLRGRHARSTLQALRWHHRIVRDSSPTATNEDIDSIVGAYKSLLQSAVLKLGASDNKTVCIENELLSIQHYRGTYEKDYITELEDFVSRAKQPYKRDSEQVTFKSWRRSHQSAFLRYQERMFDYYRHIGDPTNALIAGRDALDVEGYKTERWIQFSLRFENWLWGRGLTEERERWRRKRLASKYYLDLEEEFAPAEREYLRANYEASRRLATRAEEPPFRSAEIKLRKRRTIS